MSSFKEQLRTLPAVAGIVNSAMVLRDEFVKEWTFESFTDVMGPKIKGNKLIRARICSYPKQRYKETILRPFCNKFLLLN